MSMFCLVAIIIPEMKGTSLYLFDDVPIMEYTVVAVMLMSHDI